MRLQQGQYGDSFDYYYLTLMWYRDNVYPVRYIPLPGAGGGSREQRSFENRILEEEKDEREDDKKKELQRYAQTQGTDVNDEIAAHTAKMDGMRANPDNFSVPFSQAPDRRKVKM
jgi:hypothetical protein